MEKEEFYVVVFLFFVCFFFLSRVYILFHLFIFLLDIILNSINSLTNYFFFMLNPLFCFQSSYFNLLMSIFNYRLIISSLFCYYFFCVFVFFKIYRNFSHTFFVSINFTKLKQLANPECPSFRLVGAADEQCRTPSNVVAARVNTNFVGRIRGDYFHAEDDVVIGQSLFVFFASPRVPTVPHTWSPNRHRK